MKFYIAVIGWGGLIENVSLHLSEEKAMEAIGNHLKDSEYTAEAWMKELRESNYPPDEDYEPTNIYVVEADLRGDTDEQSRKSVEDLAHAIFDNDGIEEFLPELIDFARVASKDAASTPIHEPQLKAATHAAFGAMLLGFSVKDAVNITLTQRDDILG